MRVNWALIQSSPPSRNRDVFLAFSFICSLCLNHAAPAQLLLMPLKVGEDGGEGEEGGERRREKKGKQAGPAGIAQC